MCKQIPKIAMTNRTVAFDAVEVREYSRTLGDHPDATDGAPLAIDWDYHQCTSISVNDHEVMKQCRNLDRPMRGKLEPMSCRQRKYILKTQANVIEEQIRAVTRQVYQDQQNRIQSHASCHVDHWRLCYEGITSKIQRIASGVSKKREEQRLWEMATARESSNNSSSNRRRPALNLFCK
jgi:hypothetical protein